MILASLGTLLTGCAETLQRETRRPGTPWPNDFSNHKPSSYPSGKAPRAVTVSRHVKPMPQVVNKHRPTGVLPRSWWTRTEPIRSKVNSMQGVNRITVHHEGHTPVWFTDMRSTRARLELVRSVHTRDRHWGDIGYHYVIDRAGRVIEGRSVAYQGAHVSQQNEHNIGVMLLGNFEKQSPSQAQLRSLQSTLRDLMIRHQVPVNRVYTHRELGRTDCPGRNLQPRVASLRTSGALA